MPDFGALEAAIAKAEGITVERARTVETLPTGLLPAARALISQLDSEGALLDVGKSAIEAIELLRFEIAKAQKGAAQ